ncbi:MAG: histidine phosphatase family protein [Deltaproteobacteria bacterium]|nr:histidine phosphatase family protein [Candidatus Anaeroferrophillus wilburensis]MBN2889553.1 histidine phosphatase family protein [Deltaproteobacteria bacterium]
MKTMTDAPATTLFLLRHGQTINTLDGEFRYNGHIDIEVTDKSLQTMETMASQLAAYPITRVFSSDLSRSYQGAAVIARHLDLPHTSLAAFREIKMGRWEGLTFAEVKERYPDDIKKKFSNFINYRIPGGETIPEVEARVFGALDQILANHAGEHMILVAHGGINMLILCRALTLAADHLFRLKQDFCCINRIDYFPDFSQVSLLNGSCLP